MNFSTQHTGNPETVFHKFRADELRFAGATPHFYCIDCNQYVTEVAVHSHLGFMDRCTEILLKCHGQEVQVTLPFEMFMRIPVSWNVTDVTFVVGFRGGWGIKLRNYDWLLLHPHLYAMAMGKFEHEQLSSLFARATDVVARRWCHNFNFDSAYFDIVEYEHDLKFPAEFWFKSLKYA